MNKQWQSTEYSALLAQTSKLSFSYSHRARAAMVILVSSLKCNNEENHVEIVTKSNLSADIRDKLNDIQLDALLQALGHRASVFGLVTIIFVLFFSNGAIPFTYTPTDLRLSDLGRTPTLTSSSFHLLLIFKLSSYALCQRRVRVLTIDRKFGFPFFSLCHSELFVSRSSAREADESITIRDLRARGRVPLWLLRLDTWS